PVRISDPFPVIPAGEVVMNTEAPRGELFYHLISDGSDVPQRLKIRTPSFVNIPAVQSMVRGQHLADLPIIQASADPCCSCTDRQIWEGTSECDSPCAAGAPGTAG
ncbi:hypothetical protein EG834_08085, partial [bacterium]|nr:hypothetical protein [bacterium]